MSYEVIYYSEALQAEILALPVGLSGHHFSLTDGMQLHGVNIGLPHTKAFGDGLFELHLKSNEGIARVFYCTLICKRTVMLHSFIKKAPPIHELRIAETRMKEIKNANTR